MREVPGRRKAAQKLARRLVTGDGWSRAGFEVGLDGGSAKPHTERHGLTKRILIAERSSQAFK